MTTPNLVQDKPGSTGEVHEKSAVLNGTSCQKCGREIIVLRGYAVSDVRNHDEWRKRNGCARGTVLPNHCVRLSSAPSEFFGPPYGGHRWSVRTNP